VREWLLTSHHSTRAEGFTASESCHYACLLRCGILLKSQHYEFCFGEADLCVGRFTIGGSDISLHRLDSILHAMGLTETRMPDVMCFLFKIRSENWNLQAYTQSVMLYNHLSLWFYVGCKKKIILLKSIR
jgi:hypothetical protein